MMCATAQTGLTADEEVASVLARYLECLSQGSASTASQASTDGPGIDTKHGEVVQKCRLWYASHRRLALTTASRFVLGPAKMRAGDTITALVDARAPCVLRSRGAHYQLLGEAYVHGMMNAEGDEQIRLRLAAGDEVKVLELR